MSDFTSDDLNTLRVGIERMAKRADDEWRKVPADTSRYLKDAAEVLYRADVSKLSVVWQKVVDLKNTLDNPQPDPTPATPVAPTPEPAPAPDVASATRATDAAGHPVTYDPAVDTYPAASVPEVPTP